MTTVVVPASSLLPSWVWALCALATVIGLVVVAKEFGRRGLVLVLAGLLFVGPSVTVVRAEDEDFVIRNRCKELEPWSYEWIVNACYLYSMDNPVETPTRTKRPAPRKPRK